MTEVCLRTPLRNTLGHGTRIARSSDLRNHFPKIVGPGRECRGCYQCKDEIKEGLGEVALEEVFHVERLSEIEFDASMVGMREIT